MALYIAKLICSGFNFDLTDLSIKIDLVINLSLTVELAADQLTMMGKTVSGVRCPPTTIYQI